MSDELAVLADTLLANFVTVRFPRNEPLWRVLDDDLPPETFARCLGHAMRGELLSVRCYRLCLRLGLFRKAHREFLDYVERDPAGGWRIHLFLRSAEAVPLVASITEGDVGPGDPVCFDPIQFVQRRLSCLEKLYRVAGRCDWLDDDLP